MTLDAVACLRRFLLHVLPRGCQHLRHDGFLAHRVRPAQRTPCRQLRRPSAALSPVVTPVTGDAEAATAAPPRAEVCPVCQTGRLLGVETLLPHRAVWDVGVPLVDTAERSVAMQGRVGSRRQSRLSTASGTRASAEAARACSVWSEPMARRLWGWCGGFSNASATPPVCVRRTSAGTTASRSP